MPNAGREKFEAREAGESHLSKPGSRESRISGTEKIKGNATEIIGQIESDEDTESSAEFSEGKVSEKVKEDKKQGSAGKGGKIMTQDEIDAIRAKLLSNLPPQTIMMKQIKNKLVKQEKVLYREYRKYKKMGTKAAFQLNIVVAQLRKIKEYFGILANATFDIIKNLWLKIVHGV